MNLSPISQSPFTSNYNKEIFKKRVEEEDIFISQVELPNKDEQKKKFEKAKDKALFDFKFSQYVGQYNFNARDPEEKQMLFELAEIQAGFYNNELAKYIKNYGFDPENPIDQKMLAKLAKLLSPGKETSKYIQNFGLSDKALIAEIAKTEARTNGFKLTLNIKNFGFDLSKPEDQKMLYEIFEIAFENHPIAVDFLSDFGILDKEKRFEIGMIYASKIDPEQLGNFNPFNFVDVEDPEGPRRWISLFNELFTKNSYDAIDSFQYFTDEAIEKLENFKDNLILLQAFKEVLSLLDCGIVSDDLIKSSFSTSAKLISSFEKATKLLDPYKYTTITYLGFLACHALASKSHNEILQNLDNLYVLEALEKVFDRSLRMALIPVLSRELERTIAPKTGIASQLPILLVYALNSRDLVKKEETAILNLKTILKDGNTNKALLKTLLALIEAKELSPENVCSLIEFSLNDPTSSTKCTSQLNKLTAILNLGAEDLLVKPNIHFTSILEEAFKRKVPTLADQEGFAEKLMKTFQSSRKPVAIFEYVATLEKLTDLNKSRACQKALGEFIISVLNGTFEQERISLVGNTHLQALHEKHPEIFNKWVERNDNKLVEIIGRPIRISRTDNPYDILNCGTEVAGSCQNINGNPNLNRGVLGYLLNGHQMITLKAENPNLDKEPIIGRAIFRLAILQDNSPILFLEKIYPKTLDDSYKNELKTYANEYATTLGCPLVSKDEGDKSRPFDGPILSLGGRAAEYVDAIGGISEDCIYSIEEAFYV